MVDEKLECRKCKTVITRNKTLKDKLTCVCGSQDFNSLCEKYSDKEYAEIVDKFKSPELMDCITEELSKDHLGDKKLKRSGFLVGVSSMAENPKLRQSCALTGDPSAGKDNLTLTIFKHMPKSLFLTGATQPAIEDEAMYCPLLGLSEMNLFREYGANKNLLEIVKQRTEGGSSSIKKNTADGFKTTKLETTEQGTVFYGTTDAERNNEMETRFIFFPVMTDKSKISQVNKNTAELFSNPVKMLESNKREDSWIKQGLSILKSENKGCHVIIPFADVLLGNNKKGEPIIDTSNPRSMRDLKRIYALICARAWLYSFQREKVSMTDTLKTDSFTLGSEDKIRCQFEGVNFIKAEPEDMLEVIEDAGDFFNQTYTGRDERLNKVLEVMKQSLTDWTARDLIQRTLNKSRNTIKEWCQTLADAGIIEGSTGKDLNMFGVAEHYDANKIYYRRCQKGVKKRLIRCEYNELKELLEKYKKEDYEGIGVSNDEEMSKAEQIDTLGLTPSLTQKYEVLENISSFLDFEANEHPERKPGEIVELSEEIANALLEENKIEACNET